MSVRVVVVDDEEIKLVSLVDDLRDADFGVVGFASGKPALEHLKKHYADVVVTDLKMPGMSGLDVLKHLRIASPETDVIIMTAFGTVESAVEAMRLGAHDYVSKPFSSDELIVLLNRLVKQRRLQRDNAALRAAARDTESTVDNLVAVSPAMVKLIAEVERVAQSDAHVLLTGETGAGKDVIASALHKMSSRADRPFVKITCATYSKQLLESELFGHQRGAFTGADRAQPGRFELAHEGTVYLDDVDDIPLDSQSRLLRVIEERVVERVGGTRVIPVDVRVVASTKADLGELVERGRFRSDLYYRLNVVQLQVPPLHDRPEDIEPLIHHFCGKGSHACSCEIGEGVLLVLQNYRWPGNVRELRNLVERWKLLKRTDFITPADLPPELLTSGEFADDACDACPRSFEESVEALERRLLTDALKQAEGNKAKAADALRMKPSTFRNKLAKHGLNGDPPSAKSGA